jgi:NADPH:quinone reductase-like Zn-dependent oxidoreductase
MAELCLVEDQHCIALPNELDEKLAAAIGIPGMSSWAALVERAQLRAGETVLVNGATGTSGRLAIQIAKHLGARKVIATGRRSTGDLRALGADVSVPLVEDRDALEESFKKVFHDGVDIVLDYLWGVSAEMLMIAAAKAAPEGVPIRYVEIGSMSGQDITLPSAALRSSALVLMGSGIGSVPLPRLLEAVKGVLQAAPSAGFKAAINPVPLADISHVWSAVNTDSRIVLLP